jgi:hypothetical protein
MSVALSVRPPQTSPPRRHHSSSFARPSSASAASGCVLIVDGLYEESAQRTKPIKKQEKCVASLNRHSSTARACSCACQSTRKHPPPPRSRIISDPANRLGYKTMPGCRFKKSQIKPLLRLLLLLYRTKSMTTVSASACLSPTRCRQAWAHCRRVCQSLPLPPTPAAHSMHAHHGMHV